MKLIKKTIDEISNNFIALAENSVQIEEASNSIIKVLENG